jgi:hypothetical protein
MAVAPVSAYDEVYEFLVSRPTPEEIIAFRPSPVTQTRVQALLDANRNASLTPDERRELDEFDQVEHMVRMLKIKAREKLARS